MAALREIARVVLRSLCRLARVSLGAIAASGWKFFRLARVHCGCVLSARMRAANAPPCCGAWRMCWNSLWLAVVDYDALRSSAAAGAVAAAEKVKSYVVKFGKAQRAVEQALDMCVLVCTLRSPCRLAGLLMRYHRRCASK